MSVWRARSTSSKTATSSSFASTCLSDASLAEVASSGLRQLIWPVSGSLLPSILEVEARIPSYSEYPQEIDEYEQRQRAEASHDHADRRQDAPAPFGRRLVAGRRCCGSKQSNAAKDDADDLARWNDSH